MTKSNIKALLEEYINTVDEKYPSYSDYTRKNYEIIEEMLFLDYDCFSSDTKKLRCIKSYLKDLVENSFMNNGVKNYLKIIVGFFYLQEIKDYFLSILNSEFGNYTQTLDRLKSNINYWQGCEGREVEKLNKLLELID